MLFLKKEFLIRKLFYILYNSNIITFYHHNNVNSKEWKKIKKYFSKGHPVGSLLISNQNFFKDFEITKPLVPKEPRGAGPQKTFFESPYKTSSLLSFHKKEVFVDVLSTMGLDKKKNQKKGEIFSVVSRESEENLVYNTHEWVSKKSVYTPSKRSEVNCVSCNIKKTKSTNNLKNRTKYQLNAVSKYLQGPTIVLGFQTRNQFFVFLDFFNKNSKFYLLGTFLEDKILNYLDLKKLISLQNIENINRQKNQGFFGKPMLPSDAKQSLIIDFIKKVHLNSQSFFFIRKKTLFFYLKQTFFFFILIECLRLDNGFFIKNKIK